MSVETMPARLDGTRPGIPLVVERIAAGFVP
jgi:hypothetical protein